jgi:hypothetical protein
MNPTVPASLVLLLAASAASAQENVQFEVHGKDKVLGTIRPTYEQEAFLCRLEQGSVLKASVKAKKKTGPVPTLDVTLDGSSVGATVVTRGRGASLVPFTAPQAGLYKVVVGGDGVKDGDYELKVNFTKTSNRVTDLRDSALAGAFSGGPIVVGAVITPDDGGTVSVQNSYSPIEGSAVDIPPGALGQPTSIFIAQAAVYPVDDGVHPAGPAVEFGPSGTQFPEGKEATVTIPYEPANFPGGTDALVVYVKDANGDIQAVPGPYTFGEGTVTFVTSHFSTFQATSTGPRGLPSFGMTAYEIWGAPAAGYAGFVGVGEGSASLQDSGFLFDFAQGIQFDPGVPGQVDPSASTAFRSASVSGAATVVDDSTIDLSQGVAAPGPALRFRRGYRDDVFVLEHLPQDARAATVLVRLTDGQATLNTIAGRWHAFVWEFESGSFDAESQTVPMTSRIDAGRATISTTGAVAFTFPHRIERTTNYPSGVWTRTEKVGGQTTATIGPDSEVGLVLRFSEQGPATQIRPALDGDALFVRLGNVDRGFGSAAARTSLLVMLRESASASIRDVAGRHFDAIGGLDLFATSAGGDVAGVQVHQESGSVTFSRTKTATQDTFLCSGGYNVDGQPIYAISPFATTSASYGLDPEGDFRAPDAGVLGAFSRNGDFFVDVQSDDRSMLMGFGVHFAPELILVDGPPSLTDGR